MSSSRPLSPHLTWYRPQITSVLSITHRLTGIALSIGSVLLVWWLVAISLGGNYLRTTQLMLRSPVGLVCLAAWTLAFFYHLCSGIRHLAWDAGYGFDIRTTYRTGYFVLVATVTLSAAAWIFAFTA